jgi:hypothetical protein
MSSDENTKEALEAIESNELPQDVKTQKPKVKHIIKEQNNLNIFLKLKDF